MESASISSLIHCLFLLQRDLRSNLHGFLAVRLLSHLGAEHAVGFVGDEAFSSAVEKTDCC